MFLGLNTFEWIVVILLILILVSVWFIGFANESVVIKKVDKVIGEIYRAQRAVLDHLTPGHGSTNIPEAIERLIGPSNRQYQVLEILASHMKLALPSHGIEMLDLKAELIRKLNRAEIASTIFDLKMWLDNPNREEIEGVGVKEIEKMQQAVDKYFDEYTYVEVP